MVTLGERLDEVRRRSFAGRAAEIALFRAALGTPGVILVHGMGGIGKTALLDMFAHIAAEAGRDVARIDARHLALGADALPVPGGDVLLIDTYEVLEPIDDWVRERYLPSLPGDCLVVLAGRRPPGPRWRADPAVRIVELGSLSEVDGHACLDARGIPADRHDRLLRISRGHPLTLSLLIDAVRRGASPATVGDLPEVVGALIDEAPSPRHRAALEACAHVPAATEDLLRAMIGGEAGEVGELFAWLRSRPFIAESPYGLHPHDVVREALEADLRRRDPVRYAEMHRRKLAAFFHRVRATADEREQLELVARTVVLNGTRSGLAGLGALPPTLRLRADGLREGDRAPIIAMTAEWQGAEQAEKAGHWMARQPQAFAVFRDKSGDEPQGYAACLDLTEDDLGIDPGTDAMWYHVAKNGPPGGAVRAWRFFLDRDHGQRPSPSMTLFVACQMLDIMRLADDTAWSLVGAFGNARTWGPSMEFLDFRPATEYRIGGADYPVYAHDWRRVGLAAWTDLLHARQTGAPAEHAALTRTEFTDAVRAALRDLRQPDRIRDNPLTRSRMVRSSDRTLGELIEAGTATLAPDLAELVTRTFLRPAVSQESVAAGLYLSFNTYRRHRDRAVAQLTAWLWDRERAVTPL